MKCLSPHCVCCKRGADMFVEKRAGVREPVCRACYGKLCERLGLWLKRVAIPLPCGCGRADAAVAAVEAPAVPADDAARDNSTPPPAPRGYVWVLKRETRALQAARQREEVLLETAQQHAAMVERVLTAVAAVYGITREEMMTRSHQLCYTRPRGVAFFLLAQHGNIGISTTACIFRMHHTTVMHGIQCVEAAMEDGWPDAAEFRGVMQQLSAAITGALPLPELAALRGPGQRRDAATLSYLPGIPTSLEAASARRKAKRAMRGPGRPRRPGRAKRALATAMLERKLPQPDYAAMQQVRSFVEARA
jgi:hypothetical protein